MNAPTLVPAPTAPTVSRRSFLAAGMAGLSLKELMSSGPVSGGSVVQIFLNGGAGQLDTFDPKPEAPREIRGPLHSIATSLPGVRFSEILPMLAQRADRLVVLRSLHHDAAPIHETGLQLLRTGSLVRRQSVPEEIGAVVESRLGRASRIPASVTLNGSDSIGDAHPLTGLRPGEASLKVRRTYGDSDFGRLFWSAARLVEAGVRYVAVQTFDSLDGRRTWDAHGCPGVAPATLFDYRDWIGPSFDRALAALLDDLCQTGLWGGTLVVCTGEMGRTPRVNENAGRDHWTHAWSGLLAGGLLPGGQVIGESDPHGESILDAPVPLSELAAMIYGALDITPSMPPVAAIRDIGPLPPTVSASGAEITQAPDSTGKQKA